MLTDCRLTDMLTETWERVRLMTAVVPTAHSVPTFPRSVMCMTVVPLGSLYRSGTVEIGRGARTCNLTTELLEVVREKSTKAKRTALSVTP
jgi:hypothetical protein